MPYNSIIVSIPTIKILRVHRLNVKLYKLRSNSITRIKGSNHVEQTKDT